MEPGGTSRAVAAQALLDRGIEPYRQGRFAEALQVYVAVVERFGFPLSAQLRGEVAAVLPGLQSDGSRRRLGMMRQAISSLARCWVSGTLSGSWIGSRGVVVELDELAERFGGSEDPRTRRIAARALYMSAIMLSRLGRVDAGIAALAATFAYEPKVSKLACDVAASMHRFAGALREAGRTDDEPERLDRLEWLMAASKLPVLAELFA